MADSMIFYDSFKKAIDKISDPNDALMTYEAIIGYALTGEIPEIDGIAAIVFEMAKPQIDANQKRRESGSKGGRPKKTETEKPMVSENNKTKKPMVSENAETKKPNVNVNVNVNDNVNDNVKDKGASSRFIPPTVEEVKEYCKERGNNVDAEHFVSYYSSQRWKKANGQPVADWKGCVRTWEKTDRQTRGGSTGPNQKIHNFEERQYDFSSLEAQLTAN